MIVNLVGWIGTAIVISTYALSVRYDNAKIFHYGNVIGSILLVPVQLLAGVPYAALLSAMFGTVGFLALRKRKKDDEGNT